MITFPYSWRTSIQLATRKIKQIPFAMYGPMLLKLPLLKVPYSVLTRALCVKYETHEGNHSVYVWIISELGKITMTS